MNKVIRVISMCLACALLLFSTACENAVSSEVSIQAANEEEAIEQEGFTFAPQEIQPIEESPYMLPTDIPSESGLHTLSVEKPEMSETTNSDDVVQAILGTSNQVADIKSTDLIGQVYLETGERPVNKTLSEEDGYLSASIQKQDNVDQESDEDLWGSLYLDATNYYTLETGAMKDNANCAVLFKYRSIGATGGYTIGLSICNIGINLNIDRTGKIGWWSCDEQNQTGYCVDDTRSEYVNTYNQIDDEWYYLMVAMDERLGCRFITWQQNDPQNNAFYACDLSTVFRINDAAAVSAYWGKYGFFHAIK